jgi:uncharacterized protein (TIGR02246 family)
MVRRSRLAAGLVAIIAALSLSTACSSTNSSSSQKCVSTNESEIAGLFDQWNASLATGDPDQVVANYSPEGVLLPTLSDVPRTTPEAMREYFVDFLAKSPVGTINSRTIHIGCNMAVDTGLYTFAFKDGSSAAARFTYVYDRENDQWKIISHHSSLQPAAHP